MPLISSVMSGSILSALGLAEEECTDIWEGTTLANRAVGDKLVHFLVVLHGHHEVSWHDCLLLVL